MNLTISSLNREANISRPPESFSCDYSEFSESLLFQVRNTKLNRNYHPYQRQLLPYLLSQISCGEYRESHHLQYIESESLSISLHFQVKPLLHRDNLMDKLPSLDEDSESINYLKPNRHQLTFLNYHESLNHLNRKNVHDSIQSLISLDSLFVLEKHLHSKWLLHGHTLFTFACLNVVQYFYLT